jgi:hypothetical protein
MIASMRSRHFKSESRAVRLGKKGRKQAVGLGCSFGEIESPRKAGHSRPPQVALEPAWMNLG